MFLRIFVLCVCQIVIIVAALAIYSTGWSNLALDMKIILPLAGGIAFLLITAIILIPEIKNKMNERNVRLRAKSIASRSF